MARSDIGCPLFIGNRGSRIFCSAGKDFLAPVHIDFAEVICVEQNFPLRGGSLLCRELGETVELVLEINGGGQGLYKGFVRGRQGRMELGTLIPEAGRLRLHRAVPLEQLRRAGCWPVTGGDAVLAYAFKESGAPPKGWRRERQPGQYFLQDLVLRRSAEQGKEWILREEAEGFLLAAPFALRRPFPLLPVFCFAKIQEMESRSYVVFSFEANGKPKMWNRRETCQPE